MQFDEAVRYLLSLGHETLAIKLGLRNIELLLNLLGNPEKSRLSVQIAGTNGKGSTAVMLESICNAAGLDTGLYTSPHLVSMTERIRVGGRQISPEEFAQHANEIRNAAESLVTQGKIAAPPTFFEQLTAIAFLTFKAHQGKLAILETGLGGRLDATTIARAKLVAITPIALDHEEYLGETLESIAAEKAAIIHTGATAIVAPQTPEVLDVILKQCALSGVEARVGDWAARNLVSKDGRLCITLETPHDRYDDLCLGLRGRHQVTNAAVAIRLAESLRAFGFDIPHAAIVNGIEEARHPGRMEFREGRPSFLFDGAHNPAGTQALRKYLEEFVKAPITLVFGAMRDKNLPQMAANLFPLAERLILTRPDNPRAADIDALRLISDGLIDRERIITAANVKEAIEIAKDITARDGLICFSGSLYLIGEAQKSLQEMAAAEVATIAS